MCSLDDSSQIYYNFQAHVLNLSILWYSQCSAICNKGHGWKYFDGNVHKNFVFINATTWLSFKGARNRTISIVGYTRFKA